MFCVRFQGVALTRKWSYLAPVACYLDPSDLSRPYIVSSPSGRLLFSPPQAKSVFLHCLLRNPSIVGPFHRELPVVGESKATLSWSLHGNYRTGSSLQSHNTLFQNACDNGHHSITLTVLKTFFPSTIINEISQRRQQYGTKPICGVPGGLVIKPLRVRPGS